MAQLINASQIRRLQTLYGQYAAHAIEGSSREARLKWASSQAGRQIASFKELTRDEGHALIDSLQGQMHMKFPARKRLSRDAAKRAGTDGRRGSKYTDVQMVSAEDLAVIESYYARLGWNRAQFDGWLSSQHSPLSKRARPVIATSADANRVRWALKGMLKARGLWEERRTA